MHVRIGGVRLSWSSWLERIRALDLMKGRLGSMGMSLLMMWEGTLLVCCWWL